MKILSTLLFLFLAMFVFPQEKPTLDIFLEQIADNKLTMDEKYALIQSTGHLALTEQITMKKALLEWAKKENDKAKLITLYSMLNNLYHNSKEHEIGKIYLDSAMLYVDKTNNVDALGALYYQLGNYYYTVSDITTAHTHYYKAIEYYEQSETKQVLLSMIYYRVGSEYIEREDTLSAGRIVPKMLAIELDEPFKIYYDNINSFAASYFHLKAEKDPLNIEAYLDSSLYYLRKAVDIYHSHIDIAPNPGGARRLVCQNYYRIAKTLQERGDIDGAWENLKKGEQLLVNDPSTESKYLVAKGMLQTKRGELDEAEVSLKQAEAYHESGELSAPGRELSIIYAGLANLYAAKKQYGAAYEYKQKENRLITQINDTERYNIIKELETKHEVEKKEESIRQLTEVNEYQQKVKYLYIGIIVLVLFLLFFILIWFRNKRKVDAAQLNMVKLKQQEAELEAALGTAKLEEKNREFETLLNETQKRQLQSYLEGLEAERRRLARDLHDGISNDFVAVHMKIEQNGFDKESLQQTLGSLHDKLRGISHSLMPPVFKYADFCDIIEDYVSRQKEYFKGNAQCTIYRREAWNSLTATVALDVYRIVQEGFSNAIKHADAGNISLRFEYTGDTFQFFIEDDGKGFDPTASSRGIGLRTIRERVENLPGEVSFISETGKGTKVLIVFHMI